MSGVLNFNLRGIRARLFSLSHGRWTAGFEGQAARCVPPATRHPPAPRLVPPFPSLEVIRLIKIVFSPPKNRHAILCLTFPGGRGAERLTTKGAKNKNMSPLKAVDISCL